MHTKGELENLISDVAVRLDSVLAKQKPERLKIEVAELTTKSQAPDFWQNNQEAQAAMKQLGKLQDQLTQLESLKNSLRKLQEDLAGIESEDDDLIGILESEIASFTSELEKVELQTFLSGKYDGAGAILSVHAGQGGTEACDWTSMLLRMYLKYAASQGWKTQIVHELPGTEAGLATVTVEITGDYVFGFLKYEHGTHRLVRNSPFNSAGLRQTSFAGVEVMPLVDNSVDLEIKPEDIDFSAVRSSGAGGQNVNKVATSVRLVHKPTGITVTCSTGRTQAANREAAMNLLRSKLVQLEEEKKAQESANIKGEYKIASWGNQIRNYVLEPYKLVKDVRTGVETPQAQSVLDGDIQLFIDAEVRTLGDRV